MTRKRAATSSCFTMRLSPEEKAIADKAVEFTGLSQKALHIRLLQAYMNGEIKPPGMIRPPKAG